MGIFFVYEKKMWLIFILLLALTAVLPGGIISFMETIAPTFTAENMPLVPILSLLVTVIPIMGVMFSLMARYSIFDDVPEEALEAEPEMDKTGQSVFLIFLILTLLIAIALFYFIDFSVMNPWLAGGIFVVFLGGVVVTANFIMDRYKE